MGQEKFLILVHCDSGAGMENREDTILAANAGIAVVSAVGKMFGVSSIAFDKSYLGTTPAAHESGSVQSLFSLVSAAIQQSLDRGEQPFLLCTILNYNAEESLLLLQRIKGRFRDKIHTGVGGQHIRTSPQSFLRKLTKRSADRAGLAYYEGGYIDHVSVGHAEITLPKILGIGVDINKGEDVFVQGELNLSPNDQIHFAQPDYSSYHAIHDRLKAMESMSLGPFKPGSRQLVIEGVRGCSWAFSQGKACTMCALESIDSRPIFKPFGQYFGHMRKLMDDYSVNWLFDVSNQFVPVLNTMGMMVWLNEFIKEKERHGCSEANIYTYLTSGSLNHLTIPLLRKAGVSMAYVGIDGWTQGTQKALNKSPLLTRSDKRHLQVVRSFDDKEPPRSLETMLDQCRQNGLHIRTSLVVGSGIDRTALQKLCEFVAMLSTTYDDVVLTLGIFEQIILPGSPVFTMFEYDARALNWSDVISMYDLFREQGYLSWEQQSRLNALFIHYDQKARFESGKLTRDQMVTPDDVREAISKAQQIGLSGDSNLTVTDIEHGGLHRSTTPPTQLNAKTYRGM